MRDDDCRGDAARNNHTCAVIVYQNDDGRCRHFACEGEHADCGEIVETIPRQEVARG